MDKSYVTLSQKRCPACGKDWDDGGLLMDRRLRNTFDQKTVTGLACCEEHRKEGFITLIEVAEPPSHDESFKPTGNIAYVKSEAWYRVFVGAKPPADGWSLIDKEAMKRLQELQHPNDKGIGHA